ncbi:cobyric acid synthase [Saccharomonospora iraqiensis]|uniref:cobyric acid synthase n=1 Tax=Saccharomonospora iraqiensis TaxID=52698 RepID=UPI0003FF71E6|nr:cobyric acid synthase [Saccharomonospora iraqiensis]
MRGGVLIAGTTSDAGKSMVTAGLCRLLARRGVRVAPFKAQNMSNNSMVCPDGTEIGRAQWVQAVAAGATPESAMNPVLLKPGSDRRSHVVLRGRPWGELGSANFHEGRQALAEGARTALAELRDRYDVVVCEGAGSPAEVNLREGDYVNMGLARAADLPVLLVGDIDRGGVLAALAGTVGLLDPADQRHVAGFLINKFRGDVDLLRPGLDTVAGVTGRPVLGVLPWLADVWLDSEDTLAGAAVTATIADPASGDTTAGTLRVAAVRLPRVSNATDLDPLVAEPGVSVTFTTDPDTVAAADLAVLPGTRATVDDLDWLRRTGIARAVERRAEAGRPVLGVCGGCQMLTEKIDDGVESAAGRVPGLGLVPHSVRFTGDKTLRTPEGSWRGERVSGYEIHHGTVDGARPAEPFLPGGRHDAVWATMWHGLLENDGFRRRWLTEVAERAGVAWRPADAPGFAERRERMLDTLADAIDTHVDTDALDTLIDRGVPDGLPRLELTRHPG